MTKEKKEQTIVFLTEEIYFTVDDDCNALYQMKEGSKTPCFQGYYTDHRSMIKKATRLIIADKGTKMIMNSYLELWKEIQNDLLTIINK